MRTNPERTFDADSGSKTQSLPLTWKFLNSEKQSPLSSNGHLDIHDESGLATLAVAVGAIRSPELTRRENALVGDRSHLSRELVNKTIEEIEAGKDPLGEMFCSIRTAAQRRQKGAVYTPPFIVKAMLSWAETIGEPEFVVDPGAGSGRFLLEAGRRFPEAKLIAVEQDPLAAITARANLAAGGMARRAEVRVANFLATDLRGLSGRTLFVGNPPYVRHHLIRPKWKQWLKKQATSMGLEASGLAGLHVYFLLAIAKQVKENDFGALVTAAEWLDVNYGQVVRDLFVDRLGGIGVHLIEPKAEPFPGTATTGAITTFSISDKNSLPRFARVEDFNALGDLSDGRKIRRERLITEKRWSHFVRTPSETPKGYVELGELCRVHRGQVTGANRVWIAGKHSKGLPGRVLFSTVTRAQELIQAGPVLESADNLRQVVDLPTDLAVLDNSELQTVREFLAIAEKMGARESYTARNRTTWWSVRLRAPAPILATYMARRPPTFVLNKANARHLNIAHGLYPREKLSSSILFALVEFLRGSPTLHGGRVYAGGLTKFEPREMERIPVPGLSILEDLTG